MKLCKFEIRNFKSIQNASFEWEEIVVLIGENNAGKSSVLQALQCFLGGSQIKDPALFFQNVSSVESALELTGHFCDLSDTEMQSTAVRNRTLEGKWILKKKFWSESEPGRELVWKEMYYSFSQNEDFRGWPENDTTWASFPQDYEPLIAQIQGRGNRPNNQNREQLRDIVRRDRPDLVELDEPGWVPNPGGGGNWKSNANSIISRWIYVKAVHDATDESISKETSSYGKIVGLIVEKRLMRRPEIIELKRSINGVLRLFTPDPEHPELQAEEIRAVQDRINTKMNEVIGGVVAIKTSEVDVEPLLLPSTHLVLRDGPGSVETTPEHQGHGLQRMLVMALLQILAEIQSEPNPEEPGPIPPAESQRAVILAVEEPELYMHPQMERKMRDVLYRLAGQPNFQVICTTHSPIFLDIEKSHRTIVRVCKDEHRTVSFHQVRQDIFPMADPEEERMRIKFIAAFNPTINEVFFAARVVLLEEYSALVAFQHAAEVTGLFLRHPGLRREVTLIDCAGKGNIPMYQKVLNHFGIPYTVIHDEDRGNALEETCNRRIGELLVAPKWTNLRHTISPLNLETVLDYSAGKDKPYRAMRRINELHAASALPRAFLEVINWVYFGHAIEPGVAAAAE